LFRRPCHVPPCLINGEGGSMTLSRDESSAMSYKNARIN